MKNKWWRMFMIAVALVSAGMFVVAAGPYEADTWATPGNIVDAKVVPTLQQHGVQLRKSCSDEVFIRRVFIDLIGTLPTSADVDLFLADKSPDKRATLIEALLKRDEFAQYWSMKWCDLLRVKSEYPINLWPNAAQGYQRWIYEQLRDNRPYDQFARELLTSSGSNFRNPPVNFYRAMQGRDSAAISKMVALTFMGTRLEKWPEAKRNELANIFSRVAYKKTDEWKEEIVYLDPKPVDPLKVIYPDGTVATIAAGADPRIAFSDWLITPKNEWFTRNIVNRNWAWLMGTGVIQEADDIRADNPAACPGLLTALQDELVKAKYDMHQTFRLICNSRTYQQSSIANNDTAAPAVEFAHYKIRRLDAEVLIDALCWIGGDGEKYSSATPEPYTFIPKTNRTITLADGSITSPFLATFGRPARDTGLESERDNMPTDAQSLYLLNSSDVQRRISTSPLLRELIYRNMKKRADMVRGIYATILSRYPTPAEMTTADQYFTANAAVGAGPTANDLAWALINSKEFLCRH